MVHAKEKAGDGGVTVSTQAGGTEPVGHRGVTWPRHSRKYWTKKKELLLEGQRADQESLENQAKGLRISPTGNEEPRRLLWKGLT